MRMRCPRTIAVAVLAACASIGVAAPLINGAGATFPYPIYAKWAEAYHKAKGPASRFQWGYNYLDGLLRLTPDDTATIERVGSEVLGELDGPNRVHRRTLSRLSRLDASLKEWSTDPKRDAVFAKFRARVASACGKSGGDPAAQEGCRSFGAAKVAAS